jgi:hypothetical protein
MMLQGDQGDISNRLPGRGVHDESCGLGGGGRMAWGEGNLVGSRHG